MKSNKGFKVGLFIFIVFLIGDTVTTWMNRPLLSYIELNLLYPFIGLAGIVLLNCLMIAVFYYLYQKGLPWVRYLIILIMGFVSYARVYYIINALTWYRMKVPIETKIEVAKQISEQSIQTQSLFLYLGVPLFIFIMLIIFMVWKIDHEVETKCGTI